MTRSDVGEAVCHAAEERIDEDVSADVA